MPYHQKDSLSQNFIKYKRVVTELIEASDLTQEDVVVEIGSGRGIITNELRKKVNEVIAIEKDENLAIESNASNIDFLKFELPKRPYKIFSNIPFSITSEIMAHILTSPMLPESMYLIMQKEVADKFEGKPLETMSSIMTKPFYEIETLGEIDRTSFTLKPQIKIAFVKFVKRQKPFILIEDMAEFRNFVKYNFNYFLKIFTFAQRTNLEKMYKIADKKPSEITFDTWLILYKTYKRIANEDQRFKMKRV